mmetsp:Transcript_6618/g.8336  ORF Transcript_6618/g.8336 Transcript_6618/m.8336 type:complete len:779 (+) Transcript_6618:2557-4893(+)
MSFATKPKPKDLPALPIVIENDNLEDIDIDTDKSNTIENKYPNPYFHSNPSQYSKDNLSMMSSKVSLTNSHVSPMTKNETLMTRPRSGSSIKPRPKLAISQYVVQLDKTPLNLTPSQRLKLRKAQLSNSISNFNLPEKNSGKCFMDEESDDDEEIGEYDCVFNVPFSQPLASLSQREKFTFDNSDRKSLATDSTRSSSILSHESFAETSSVVSCNCDDNSGMKSSNCYNNSRLNRSLNALSMDDLSMSKDAQDLTLLFNRTETVQINEESRQRRKMLNNFKRIPKSMPSTPIEGSFSDLSISDKASSSEFQLQRNPRSLSQRSKSQPVIPMSTKERKHLSAPSKYYTFTRPTWLPPKSSYDRIKHQKESEDIIFRALQKEAQERKDKLKQLEKLKILRKKDVEAWRTLNFGDDEILRQSKNNRKVQEMYWRGILENIRSRIWQKQIGNTLNLHEKNCDAFFDKYDSIFIKKVNTLDSLLRSNAQDMVALEQLACTSGGKEMYNEIKNAEVTSSKHINMFLKANQNMLSIKALYDRTSHDLLDTYPDIKIFQNYDVLLALTRVIISFIIYLNETREKIEINEQTLGKLNTNYYFTGLNTLAAILYYHNRSSHATFISLANIYEREVPKLLLNYKAQTDITKKQLINSDLCEIFMKKFDSSFKKYLGRLSTHFDVIGLKSFEFVPQILSGLFSNLFNFELSCQIMDIYAFEDTSFLLRCLLALLKQTSFKLFGTKQEVLDLLGEKNRENLNNQDSNNDTYRYLNVGYDYQFVQTVKEMVL